jgi:hypothetical protein
MRNLIFGTLKVLEVVAYFVICWLIGLVLDLAGLNKWFDKFLESLSTTWLIVFALFWLILGVIWVILIFQDWIAKNWIWTDQVICFFKKRGQK